MNPFWIPSNSMEPSRKGGRCSPSFQREALEQDAQGSWAPRKVSLPVGQSGAGRCLPTKPFHDSLVLWMALPSTPSCDSSGHQPLAAAPWLWSSLWIVFGMGRLFHDPVLLKQPGFQALPVFLLLKQPGFRAIPVSRVLSIPIHPAPAPPSSWGVSSPALRCLTHQRLRHIPASP